MLYIVTKCITDKNMNVAVEEVEVFTSNGKVIEFVRDLHDDIMESFKGTDAEDSYTEDACYFDITHPEYHISVQTFEKEIN